MVVLDEHAFKDVDSYSIVYCLEEHRDEYLKDLAGSAIALYEEKNFLIMKILSADFKPAKNDGVIGITKNEAKLVNTRFDYPVITSPDTNITNLLSKVTTNTVMSYIQTLEDFETRNVHHSNHNLARNWLKQQYEALGLEVSLHNFTWNYYGTPYNNDNVIAIQYGTEFPNEYIVLGGHYDSYAYESQSIAYGADDDASGSAGILETARILSQYNFKRSIIYCAFSAEEYGLYGSGAYAQKCLNESMNILGYFNLDMTGYLRPGDPIHMCLIYPSNALTLADYFVNICDIYFPAVPVTRHANLSWGDSDHTSFNNKGYKGIWWFEDTICDSPHIHHIPGGTMYGGFGNNCTGTIPCLGDKIGPSVNNPEQTKVFTQAMVASIATLALLDVEIPQFPPPTDCKAEYLEGMKIKITWEKPEETGTAYLNYAVYKDDVYVGKTSELQYVNTVTDFTEHCYTITAIYNGVTESEFSNESCASVPLFPPTNCTATWIEIIGYGSDNVSVTWKAPTENTPDEYFVYRKNMISDEEIMIAKTIDTHCEDWWGTDGHLCYKVQAIYGSEASEFSNDSCVIIPVIDGVDEYNSTFMVIPNPTTGELTIDNGQLTITSVEVFDIYGRTQNAERRTQNAEGKIVLDISYLPTGNYFLRISTEKTTETIKIVKL
jgi:hypothetical protein